MPRIMSYSPSRLNADVIGWNCHLVSCCYCHRAQDTHRALANVVPCRIHRPEVVVARVKRVHRELNASEHERDIDLEFARDEPHLAGSIVLRFGYTSVNSVRNLAGNLGKGESGIKHSDELVVVARHDRLVLDGTAIRPDEAILKMEIGTPSKVKFRCGLVPYLVTPANVGLARSICGPSRLRA